MHAIGYSSNVAVLGSWKTLKNDPERRAVSEVGDDLRTVRSNWGANKVPWMVICDVRFCVPVIVYDGRRVESGDYGNRSGKMVFSIAFLDGSYYKTVLKTCIVRQS